MDKAGLHKLLDLGDIKSAASILIFSEEKGNRLNYVCEFIFNHVLKVNYLLTTDIKEFEGSKDPKINYSTKEISGALRILPYGLLSEKGVSEKKPTSEIKKGMIYFYENGLYTDFHFDIFSTIFYFISRYEEWQSFEKDEHGRFELKESVLFKNNFNLKPVVEIWIEELKKALVQSVSSLQFSKREFKSIATIDVDNLYAYKGKGFIRTVGAGLKDILKFDLANLKRRISVVKNKIKDPFDIYENFSKFCAENKIPLIYFFLFKTGTKFDRTVDPESEEFKKVFNTVKNNSGSIGLHPSYYSSTNSTELKNEVLNFSKKTGKPTNLSRQHYLRFDIKTTPALLLANGIVADFSMGFASGAGFRAGTSTPFYYYNFNSELKTDLLFVPFCAMDGAYFIYNSVNAKDAYASILKIKQELKKVNGLFVTVFHERTFAEHLYSGFGEMYKKLLMA